MMSAMDTSERIHLLRRRFGTSTIAALLDLTPEEVVAYTTDPSLPDAPIMGASDIAFAYADSGIVTIPAGPSGEHYNVGLNGYNGQTIFNDPDVFELPYTTDGVPNSASQEGPLRIKRPGVYDIYLSTFTPNWMPAQPPPFIPTPALTYGQDEIFAAYSPVVEVAHGQAPNQTFQFIWQMNHVGNITVAPVDLWFPWRLNNSIETGIMFTLLIKRVGEVAGSMSA